ncbi:MAG: aminotransferase class I/II-fold pyridoxal phosphate-dependent enzyme [Deltaproteobacteria bacterium]|jgi:cystathionine beta-lyase/cystathionine gamma-synthase|nr:aminotransferase class I/II-fold pyridoxal phosphate-dependent enzyme [Deltaproteobacteria bacterium]
MSPSLARNCGSEEGNLAKQRKPPRYVARPETEVLSRGYDPSLSVGSARPAVFRSSTYVFSTPESAERAFEIALGKVHAVEDENVELIYSRLSHPNAEILEDHLVPLEVGASSAAVFNSGMAAISTLLLTLCRPGSSVVHTVPVYGGTHMLLYQLLETHGIHPIAVNAGDSAGLARAIAEAENLAVVFVESPANPTLRMTDIAAVVAAADKCAERPVVAIDNTFMGPIFQHPLKLGADVCIYSATKYLAGFSDMLGGAVVSADPELVSHLRSTRVMLGNILQPDECWLLDSRLATVSLRMHRQSKNAKRIVDRLVGHPQVSRIHYPSLFDDAEQKRIYAAQCDWPGGIFSLDLGGDKRKAFEFLRRLHITKNAVSLGGMESLACHPATTTHSEMTDDQRDGAGVTQGLVRISVGIENWRDLLREYTDALDEL